MNKKMNLLKCACCIIVMCSVFISCGQECQDDPNLNAQDLSWISMYSSDQLLHFKSDTGSIDTLIITFDDLTMGNSDNGCIYKDQNDIVSANFFDGSFSSVGNQIFDINIQHGNKYYYSLQFPHGVPSLAQLNGHNFSDYTPQNNIVINGISYNGVYVMPNYNIPNNFIYYTKQNGVIAYDDNNGHQWVKIN
jgi:hypothetical protein